MSDDEGTSSPRRPGPALIAILGIGGAAGLFLVMCVLFGSSSAPAWLVSLARSKGPVALAALVLGAGLWLGFGAAVLGLLLLRHPRLGLALPLWTGLVGGVVALALGVCGADGSGPALRSGGGLGLLLLFGYVALLVVLGSGIVAGLTFQRDDERPNTVLFLLLTGLPWAILAHVMLVGRLSETWLAEMVRPSPVPGHVPLAALVVLVGLNGAAVGYGLLRPRWRIVLPALGVTLALAVLGYVLLRLGLSPVAGDEGGPRAGHLLLLGPEAAGGSSAVSLLVRWAVVQVGAVGMLGLGHLVGAAVVKAVGLLPASAPAGRAGAPRPAPAEVGEEPPSRGGRAYAVATLLCAVLVVYGSLVPLQWRPRPFEEALGRFLETPYLTLGVWNRADLVANLLLFVPLTFVATGWLTGAGARGGRWLIAPLVMAGAGGLAVGIEFAQVYFPPRTVSLNDILAECVGGVLGVGLWLTAGRALTAWGRRGLRAISEPTRLARYVLTAYVVGFAVYQLFPFDVVLSADEMLMQLRQGKVVVIPFGEWGRLPAVVVLAKVLVFVPVGYWVVVRRREVRWPVVAALVRGGVFAVMVEALQVCVFSRYSSMTDVVLGAGGSLVGGVLATRFGPAARNPLPEGRAWRGVWWLLRLAAAGGVVAVLVWGKWTPFAYRWPEQGLLVALAERVHVPFYYQYWNSEFEAVGQLLRDVAAPAVLALFVVSLLPRVRGRRGVAAVVAAAVAAVVELGQVLFPPHVPDLTTAVLAAGGAVAGVYVYGPFVRGFVQPPGAGEAEGGPEEPT